MSARKWIKTRYFTRVPTKATCQHCKESFEYVKTSKPRLYCLECAVDVQEARVREYNEFVRQMRRAARMA